MDETIQADTGMDAIMSSVSGPGNPADTGLQPLSAAEMAEDGEPPASPLVATDTHAAQGDTSAPEAALSAEQSNAQQERGQGRTSKRTIIWAPPPKPS